MCTCVVSSMVTRKEGEGVSVRTKGDKKILHDGMKWENLSTVLGIF